MNLKPLVILLVGIILGSLLTSARTVQAQGKSLLLYGTNSGAPKAIVTDGSGNVQIVAQ